jgi:hypothetical protein
MASRDGHDSLGGSVDCAACGVVVPADGIRVLARRDDIAFVELHCPSCRSESLGIVITAESFAEGLGGPVDPDDAFPVAAGRRYGEFGPGDAERFRQAPPIDDGDLRQVHELLAHGGLAALVGRQDPPAAGSGR